MQTLSYACFSDGIANEEFPPPPVVQVAIVSPMPVPLLATMLEPTQPYTCQTGNLLAGCSS